MRHRISVLLAAALAGTALVLLGPAQPSGAVLVCAGEGVVSVAPGLLYPVLGGITGGPMKDHVVDVLIGDDNTTHGFVFSIGAGGACVHVAVPPTVGSGIGHGVLKGYCGHSSGTGTLNGQPFSFIESGGVVLLTGHVVGGGHIMPALGTGSCAHFEPVTPLPSGATTFIVTLVGAGLNCNNALPPQETLTRLIDQDFLVVEPTTGISLLGIHVHLGLHTWTTPICTSPDVLL
jgi:hypothetical protein